MKAAACATTVVEERRTCQNDGRENIRGERSLPRKKHHFKTRTGNHLIYTCREGEGPTEGKSAFTPRKRALGPRDW